MKQNLTRFWMIAVCLGIPFGCQISPAQAADRPNIILFLIDDQDLSSIGAYGGKTYTPHLDRIAAEGMKFTRAYVSSSVCTPSRYSFATGRYAGNSTSKKYIDACGGPGQQGFPNFNMTLERDRMNVGHVLSKAGYETGWVGKFHMESTLDYPEFYRRKEGLRDVPKKTLSAGPQSSALFAHNEAVMRRFINNLGFTSAQHVYLGNLQSPYNHHNPEWTTQAALQFIEQNKGRPFYLHCCSTLLHGPAKSWRRSMDYPRHSGVGELKTLPDVMTPRRELLRTLVEKGFDPNSPTAGEAWIDDAVGTVLKKLKELNIDDNTLLLFAADHGRRGKGSLFSQNGVNVAMIARWPAQIPANVTCDELVQNVDWAPTVFEAAGVTPPVAYRMDGRSLLPLLRGDEKAAGRDHVYVEMGHSRGVATKRWKYIAVRYPREQIKVIQNSNVENLPRAMSYIGRLGIGTRGADRPGFWDADQLYDLQADPGEMNNLAADPQHADELQRMRQLLTADLKSIGRPFGEFVPGGNAVPGGKVDEQIALVKTLTIRGKRVIVPEAGKSRKNKKARRKAKRRQRKKKKATP